MSNLFQLGQFLLHSGETAHYKIECDALTENDYQCLAALIAERVGPFGRVEGVPRGGLPLANALEKYTSYNRRLLIVDDVWTTGNSMEMFRDRSRSSFVVGAVIFARNPVADWVIPLFTLTPVPVRQVIEAL